MIAMVAYTSLNFVSFSAYMIGHAAALPVSLVYFVIGTRCETDISALRALAAMLLGILLSAVLYGVFDTMMGVALGIAALV